MNFIEADKSVRNNEWFMQDLHSHNHYEFYFLTEGNRSFFLSNALFTIKAPSIIIIPPHALHKTEGGPFTRYNINVSTNYLDAFEKEELDKKALHVIKPDEENCKIFIQLIEEMLSLKKIQPHYDDMIQALFSYTIYILSKLKTSEYEPNASNEKDTPPVILKVIDYLQSSYSQKITLDELADKFYLSKGALIYNFKKYTNCSLIDFLLNLRLTKAKELLSDTKISIQGISEKCGFSTANYFSLIFKQKEGISPQNYRKIQFSKL